MSQLPTKSIAIEIGQRIKSVREAKNLTQEEVGRALGIGRAGYANIEIGRSLIRLEHLMKLPDILHYPITYFLGIDGELSDEERKLIATYRSLHVHTSNEVLMA